MENASKALIIAGAILISILLISVGIIIMNAINDPVSRGADSAAAQAAQIFNSQFSGFIGTNVDYNTTKQFFVTVTSANSTATVGLRAGAGSLANVNQLNRNNHYDISLTDVLGEDGNAGSDGFYDTFTVVVHP